MLPIAVYLLYKNHLSVIFLVINDRCFFLVLVLDSPAFTRYRIVLRQVGILQTFEDIFKTFNMSLIACFRKCAWYLAQSVKLRNVSFLSRGRGFESIVMQFFVVVFVFSIQYIFEDNPDQTEKNFQGNIAYTLSDILTFYQ